MACFRRDPTIIEGKQKDKEIEILLKQHKKILQKKQRVLLLGSGGGGKTTFLNQMKLIYSEDRDDAFSNDEKLQYRTAIFLNVYTGIVTLIRQMDELRIKYAKADNEVEAGKLKTMSFNDCWDGTRLKTDFVLVVHKLWRDEGIKKCFQRRGEFHLEDSVKYFLDKLDEVSNPHYSPSTKDILHTRIVTKEAYSHAFDLTEGVTLELIDVGGQRPLRSRWMPLFDDVSCIIFVTSLAEFNQTLEEDSRTNRTVESLSLFRNILEIEVFKRIPIILFLNKKDLFDDKLSQGVQFTEYFPDFESDDEELQRSATRSGERVEAEFLRQIYHSEFEAEDATRSLYSHITQATDKGNIKRIWTDVKDVILNRVLNDMNL